MKKILFLSLFFINAQAQDTLSYNYLKKFSTIGIGGGTSHYYGDIHPYSDKLSALDLPQWNFLITYNKYFGKHFSIRTSLNWIRITADDEHFASKNLDEYYQFYLRNLHFRNDIKELSLMGAFNLNSSKKLSPYIFGGVALYAHRPIARNIYDINNSKLNAWSSLNDLQTSGQSLSSNYPKPYSLLATSIPFGVGLQARFKNNFIVSIELNVRHNFNDNLDDILEGEYPNPAELGAVTPLGEIFSNRTGEDYSAFSGKSRIENANYIYTNKLNLTGNITPSIIGTQVFGYSANTLRGTGRNDTYLTSNLTVSYIFKHRNKKIDLLR